MAKQSGNGHKTETPDVSHIRNVEVTHETSDVNVNGVLTFVVGLTILTISVFIGLIFLFNYFKGQAAKEVQPGPMALSPQERLPPEPRLQEAPGFGVTLADEPGLICKPRSRNSSLRRSMRNGKKNLTAKSKMRPGTPRLSQSKTLSSKWLRVKACLRAPGRRLTTCGTTR